MKSTDSKGAGGRPTKYRAAHCKIAKQLSKLGATDFEIATALSIDRSTFYLWMQTHPKFSDAVKLGKRPANRRTERSLFERANGYSYQSEEVFLVDHAEEIPNPDDPKHPTIIRTKKALRVPTVKHVPPDPTSIIFFLKNREREKWRDFKATELSTPPGRPLGFTLMDNGEGLKQAYLERLASMADDQRGTEQETHRRTSAEELADIEERIADLDEPSPEEDL